MARGPLSPWKEKYHGEPRPIELRERVVAFLNEGNSNRETTGHFRVSPWFGNNIVTLKLLSGSLTSAQQGPQHAGTTLRCMAQRGFALQGEVTVDELYIELVGRGVEVPPRQDPVVSKPARAE